MHNLDSASGRADLFREIQDACPQTKHLHKMQFVDRYEQATMLEHGSLHSMRAFGGIRSKKLASVTNNTRGNIMNLWIEDGKELVAVRPPIQIKVVDRTGYTKPDGEQVTPSDYELVYAAKGDRDWIALHKFGSDAERAEACRERLVNDIADAIADGQNDLFRGCADADFAPADAGGANPRRAEAGGIQRRCARPILPIVRSDLRRVAGEVFGGDYEFEGREQD